MTANIDPVQMQKLVDVGNTLLSQVPATLDGGTVWAEGGQQVAILTLRTASATQTVFLTPTVIKTWAKLINDLADSMSESGLIAAGPGMNITG